ncbi:Phosphatidylserine/phosphatidylglycerophosphate/cardiolipin synthase [Marinococcus luteus]|uniref:Phosphatidylserine/phosphatidylglycerophosphate/cardiolipin synthase n=1 Tax=Marinococcus luteus TaxID=1122204 RepID=A0A1H2UR13_9BACI|nr:phospholipase D family protein [Marinococcus luteus]SDW58586.1 Phosphatidylserine/phosphatidylglycerophosphate/cardiolipin synthase [Marinococcus luteus]
MRRKIPKVLQRDSLRQKWMLVALLGTISAVVVTAVYGSNKPLPANVSYEGKEHRTDNVRFLEDHTYVSSTESKVVEQEIFDTVMRKIEEADQFIVMDMFYFNSEHEAGADFPPLTRRVSEALINKKEAEPDIEIVVITDPVNTFYGAYTPEHFQQLEESGIEVIFTELEALRDSNPLYSGFYRTFVQWFGNHGRGWLPNFFSSNAPDVTLRSYLEILNFKANHRKTLVTEKAGMVTSANPHDASGYHANTGFEVRGAVLKDLLKTEKAVAEMAGRPGEKFDSFISDVEVPTGIGEYKVQLLTERKIKERVLREIRELSRGGKLRMGMFYLADRDVIEALIEAANRGADINIIMDINEEAFGSEKIGIPNQPAAHELVKKTNGRINIRWYHADGVQYHAKMMMMEKTEQTVVIGGSANMTRRNLDNYNLETDVVVTGNNDSEAVEEVRSYYQRLWNNSDGTHTLDYKKYKNNSRLLYWRYRLQEWSGMSSF